MKAFFEENQQIVALAVGYALVFGLAFGLGKITTYIPSPPEIKVEEPAGNPQPNNSAEVKGTQTATGDTAGLKPVDGECGGKIKGNISSSGRIYHKPGGSFYSRTQAEMCFDSEASAQDAGFRKSSR